AVQRPDVRAVRATGRPGTVPVGETAHSRKAASVPAAPAIAAPPAAAAISQRVARGSRGHAAAVTATSRASDSAPAAYQAPADREPDGACRTAASAPRPRARSRAPSARPNT